MTCHAPPEAIKRLNTVLYKFILGVRDRIEGNVFITPIEYGEVRILDVESYTQSLQTKSITRFFCIITTQRIGVLYPNIL